MKKIMNWLMLSCKKATELIEKKLLIKLSFKENVQLQLHKSMCNACTAYEKQSKKMDELFHIHINSDGDQIPGAVQNEDLKEKIINALNEN
jgi:hypothetical protein